jgi:sugar/nucleoside kinase (ribokinase family)
VIDLVMRLDSLPTRGGDVFARAAQATPGGGFNVMLAAVRDGAAVVYAGGHGSGLLGDLARQALRQAGILVVAPPDTSADTGISVVLVDDAAERTFVTAPGSEFGADGGHWLAAGAGPGDIVYVTGYSLVRPDKRDALMEWLGGLDPGVALLFDPSPLVGELPLGVLRALARRGGVWSLNQPEAVCLAGRLNLVPGLASDSGQLEVWDDAAAGAMAVALADGVAGLDRADRAGRAEAWAATGGLTGLGPPAVVVRFGPGGAAIAQAGRLGGPTGARLVPGLTVKAVDTNGAGDTHCGVMAAALLRGADLDLAVRRANVAAALLVARSGPSRAPWAAEIDAAL